VRGSEYGCEEFGRVDAESIGEVDQPQYLKAGSAAFDQAQEVP
jgi:hypothetical protein